MMKKEDGSIVLEVALVMPFYLAFIIALICMIKLLVIDSALQSALSETTKQIATHAYPFYLGYGELEKNETFQSIKETIGEFNGMIDKLPEVIREPVKKLLKDTGQEIQDILSSLVLRPIVHYYSDPNIEKDHLDEVIIIQLPSLKDSSVIQDNYLTIQASYKLVLPIPFIRKEVTLKKQASERLWVGL